MVDLNPRPDDQHHHRGRREPVLPWLSHPSQHRAALRLIGDRIEAARRALEIDRGEAGQSLDCHLVDDGA